MIFWLILAAMALVVVSVLLLPLVRSSSSVTGREADVAVYRDQLSTLDAEIARGAVNATEAETTRVELQRRLIAAGAAVEAKRGDAPARADRLAIVATAIIVLIGGTTGYMLLGQPGRPDAPLAARIAEAQAMREATQRPPQAVVEAMVAAQAPSQELSARDADLVEQLAAVVAARPTDMEGRRLLARSYMQLGRYLEGRQIQGEVVDLAGEAVTAEDLAALAEYMIVAAGGYVSPEAERFLDQTLALAPRDPWARYYLARTRAQTGEMDTARALLDELANDPSTPDELRSAVRDDLTMLTGPDTSDIEAASEMDPVARMEMIEGMVTGLAARIEAEGGAPAEWARLIRAYDVLGRGADADAAYARAREVFAGDAAALATLGAR